MRNVVKATSATIQARNIASALAAKSGFVADKSKVMVAFTSTMLFDFEAIGAIVNAYAGKAEFVELRVACFELAIKSSLEKAGEDCDAARAHGLALHDATQTDAAKLSDAEKAAKKSARNKWFAFTQKCKIVTQDARGGANNVAGRNGAATKRGAAARDTEVSSDDDTDQEISDAPVTLASIVVERLPSLMELGAHYVAIKHHLIKLQAANAKVYAGEEGSKLLARHKRIVAILNEA